MKQDDILLALHTLGAWIDRMEKEGFGDDVLIPCKHAYIRIHWWMVKNPDYSPTPSLTE